MSGPSSDQSRPVVALPQGSVVGVVQQENFPRPVECFLGIPYAQPPVGELRFRPPVPVAASSDIIDASKYGPAAPPAGKWLRPIAPFPTSEDCLTANVFRHVPEQTKSKLLPVAVYVHGGAYNRGNSAFHKTASMVAWSEEPFVAVSFNYRIGALGFLPSRKTASEGLLNLGLKDQRLLLQWVQENIHLFGGNKNNVTLFGLSSGAHSIGHHILHHTRSNPAPFHRAIIESGAANARAVHPFNAKIHEDQFREFLQEAGCPLDLSASDTFEFLRSLSLSVISEAQSKIFEKYNPSVRWAFQPVVDGDVIPRPPIVTLRTGEYNCVPIIIGHCTNEGTLYTDKQLSRPEQFTHFWRILLPDLSAEDIAQLEKLYPDPSSGDPTHQNGRTDVGPQYHRAEAAYGQYAYIAPVRHTAHLQSLMKNAPPVYVYHWALTSTVNGATHGDNMYYETYQHDIISRSEAQRELAGINHAYVTSFITKGDPNAVPGRYPHRPTWQLYTQDSKLTMVFGRGNRELVGGSVDGPAAEMVHDDWAQKQCEFWWSIENRIQ
ncbi:Lipase 4 [Exophiala dermatitidis]